MMRHLTIAAITFWLTAVLGFSLDSSKHISLSDYVAELDHLAAAAESCPQNLSSFKETLRNLPHQWIIQTGQQHYTVTSEWLKTGMQELKGNSSEKTCRSVKDRIAALKLDAQSLQQPAKDFSSSRKTLARILSQREFHNLHGPTAWDRLKEKINAFLFRLLGGIFNSSAFSNISTAVIWLLAGGAGIVLAFWIFKTLKQNVRLETIALSSSAPVSAQPWTTWMANAHAAASKECWRDAVHLSYWAGIAFLESHELWRPDRARTPREYLKLLSSSNEHWNSLNALTRKFEAIWYGYAEAGPESFSESLKYLESMGCHSN
jgi:hypothetical protein